MKLKQTALHELEKWQCPECADLTAAENDEKKYVLNKLNVLFSNVTDKLSFRLFRKFDPQQLNKLLKFVMDRILVDTNVSLAIYSANI